MHQNENHTPAEEMAHIRRILAADTADELLRRCAVAEDEIGWTPYLARLARLRQAEIEAGQRFTTLPALTEDQVREILATDPTTEQDEELEADFTWPRLDLATIRDELRKVADDLDDAAEQTEKLEHLAGTPRELAAKGIDHGLYVRLLGLSGRIEWLAGDLADHLAEAGEDGGPDA